MTSSQAKTTSSQAMLDAFLVTVVRLAGARAGTLRIASSNGEPELVVSWERVPVPGASTRAPATSVVLPLEHGGETLGEFTLLYDAPAVGARGRAAKPPRLRTAASRARMSESLTTRERQILSQIALGQSNKAIARVLGISPDTVKLHVRHILAKLGCASRVEAAVLAAQHDVGREHDASLAV